MDRVSKTGKVVEPAQTKGVKELLDVKYKVFWGSARGREFVGRWWMI
jgi:hypothetical protein